MNLPEKTSETTSENTGPAKPQNLTPLMKQYWEVKAQHTDKILLFRMGDFFEMFHDDAVNAAPVMGIALTSRNKNSEEKTPMCGVPFHSIGPQINKLLKAGFKVAICDQLEEASQAKGLVRRGVTRILTPGLVFDPETLDASLSNYLASYDDESISFLDASTFEAFTFKANAIEQKYLLQALRPVEMILSEEQKAQFDFGSLQVVLSVQHCEKQNDFFMSQLRLKAYLSQMQASEAMTLVEFEMRELGGKMHLSQNSIKSLEIFENYQKETRASLFESIDRTKTSAGKRLLKSWLRFPLVQQSLIEKRLDQVQAFTDSENLKSLRATLARMGDIERRLSKISSPNVSPRDLLALCDSLAAGLEASHYCPQKIWSDQDLSSARLCIELILTRINEEAPVTLKHGNVIKPGVSKELDDCLALSTGAQDLLSQLEARERELTGISTLKIRYNNIFGYYIEITNSHKDKVPVARYERKQTLAGSERYMTKELAEIETKVLGSQAKKLELEIQIFEDLRQRILKNDSIFLRLAREWAEVDVLSALAYLAMEQDYKRPKFMAWDKTKGLSIKASRHPVIEQNLKIPFKANDISLGLGDCMLLTGPNMAGKSTLMRQVAIASLMAQMGSFIPCESAELPIFDQIFTRIGANDFLSEGLSTFMVEMKETAEILNGATAQSLVILDEIGRGTSTYDGMSLAQAILEHLLSHISCVTFFATHYHELTELTHQFPNLKSAHMRVSEVGGEVRFLHTLTQGSASKSYGIHVAKLAGLPKTLTSRAAHILKDLEEVPLATQAARPQLSFNLAPEVPRPAVEFLKNLRSLHLEKMTPIEAMMSLSQFQTQLTGSEFEEFLNS